MKNTIFKDLGISALIVAGLYLALFSDIGGSAPTQINCGSQVQAGTCTNTQISASAAIEESKISFATSTGHNHDGTAGQGHLVPLIQNATNSIYYNSAIAGSYGAWAITNGELLYRSGHPGVYAGSNEIMWESTLDGAGIVGLTSTGLEYPFMLYGIEDGGSYFSRLILGNSYGATSSIILYDGSHYGMLIAPSSLGSNLTWTLPSSSGTIALTSGFGAYVLKAGDTMTGTLIVNNDVTATGTIQGETFTSTVGVGTAPIVVTSTTLVNNLNADMLDGSSEAAFFKLADNEVVTGIPAFNGGLTGASAPFTVDSTYVVSNLNADLLDGNEASAFAAAAHNHDTTYLKLDGSNDPITGALTVNNDFTATGTISAADTNFASATVNGPLHVTGKLTADGIIDPTRIILHDNSTSATVEITQDGAGRDIQGTSASWYITKTGDMTAAKYYGDGSGLTGVGGATAPLSDVLAVNNSAGIYDVDLNGNDILNVNAIAANATNAITFKPLSFVGLGSEWETLTPFISTVDSPGPRSAMFSIGSMNFGGVGATTATGTDLTYFLGTNTSAKTSFLTIGSDVLNYTGSLAIYGPKAVGPSYFKTAIIPSDISNADVTVKLPPASGTLATTGALSSYVAKSGDTMTGALTVNNNIIATGTLTTGTNSLSGSQDVTFWGSNGAATPTKFLWDASKAAVRAGYCVGTNCDDASVGMYSIGMGNGFGASGLESIALGSCSSTAAYSVCLGHSGVSQGSHSTMIGYSDATKDYSTAIGYNNQATGNYSVVLGNNDAKASGASSVAIGEYVTASNTGSHVIGRGISSSDRITNSTANSLAIGFNSTVPTLFVGPAGGTAGSVGGVGIGTMSVGSDILTASGTVHIVNNKTNGSSIFIENTKENNGNSALYIYSNQKNSVAADFYTYNSLANSPTVVIETDGKNQALQVVQSNSANTNPLIYGDTSGTGNMIDIHSGTGTVIFNNAAELTLNGYEGVVWDNSTDTGRWAITSSGITAASSGTYTFPHAYSTVVSCVCSFYNSDAPGTVISCGIKSLSVSACEWQLGASGTGTVYINAFGY